MHRSIVSLAVAITLPIAGIASYAWADPQLLITPALQLGTPAGEEDYGALCTAINVSVEPRQIQLAMFDGQGVRTRPAPTPTPGAGATPTPGPTQTPIAFLGSAILGDPGYEAPGSSAAGLRYCIVIFDGEPDDVRASMCVTDNATGRCVTVVEAR